MAVIHLEFDEYLKPHVLPLHKHCTKIAEFTKYAYHKDTDKTQDVHRAKGQKGCNAEGYSCGSSLHPDPEGPPRPEAEPTNGALARG
ncbi:hypothetical protein TNIN_359731 [Trichonephila inaurata madagascariensis]|uniref:Uncharacterized protein n=1 Tax=Trichonephila inaurata madagascariensis TaxID=2747483 RepID=A0A8X6INI1_9ARAC|nr:hypothetical protein TNIN_359731 [Trichonephila inaurata madagascariensis]